MKTTQIEMDFQVPKEEYDKISIMLVRMGQAVLQKMTTKKAQVKMPSTNTQIISFAYRELILSELSEYNNGRPFERIKLPVWLTTNCGTDMVHIKVLIDNEKHQEMITSVKTLYPDVYNNSKIKNDDFIAAAGIVWAHRYISGKLNITVEQGNDIAK